MKEQNDEAICSAGPAPRLLVLGGGPVVTEYYLPALRTLGWESSSAICDPDARAVRALRSASPAASVQQRGFAEALRAPENDGRFDAVIVALPNHLHDEAVTLALERDLHVLCEKPLALSREACIRLAGEAEARGKVLAVGMARRLLPSFQAVRAALASGLVGPLTLVDIEDGGPYSWMSESGAPFRPENGGVLADMGIHYLDLAESLLGRLEPTAMSDDRAGGVEANAEMELRSASGVRVHLALSRTHLLRNTARFQGEAGELVVEKDTFDSCLWRSAGGLTGKLVPERPFGGHDWPMSLHSCFAQQLLNFGAAIRGKPGEIVTAYQAAETVGLVEWAYSRSRRPSGPLRGDGAPRPTLPASPVAVTGGTGFIGATLVERLAEAGCAPIVLPIRRYRTVAQVARFPVTTLPTDLLDPERVREAVAGSRFVFHLAYGREGADAARVTVEGTRNVVEAAIASGAEAVVVLSTMYVFGHPETPLAVDETWPYDPAGGEYGSSKATMERWCLDRARSSSATRIVVLNPSCVYGPRGTTYTAMPVDMAMAGTFCWIEGGRGIANYTYVDNLIDAIISSAMCAGAHGYRLIVNDGSATWREVLEPLLDGLAPSVPSCTREELAALHRGQRAGLRDIARILLAHRPLRHALLSRPSLRASLDAATRYAPGLAERLRATASEAGDRGQEARAAPAVPPVWLADVFGPTTTTFSAEKARQVLGWRPLVDLETGQRRTVDWLRRVGKLP